MSLEIGLIAGLLLAVVIAGAVIVWARRVISDPAYYRKLLLMADNALAENQAKDARAAYLKAISGIRRVSSPSDELRRLMVDALLRLGNVDAEAGDRAVALLSYREALKWGEVPGPITVEVAADYALSQDESPPAVDAYVRYLTVTSGSHTPSDPVIEFLRDRCDARNVRNATIESAKETVALLGRLVSADPTLEWARLALGVGYGRLGEFEKGIVEILEFESLAPQVAAGPYELGHLYLAANSLDEAWSAFRRSLDLDSVQPDALFQLARIDLKRIHDDPGRQSDLANRAQEYLSEACRLEPSSAVFWHELGRVELLRNRPADARVALERAVELDGSNVEYHVSLAECAAQLTDTVTAVTHLREALDLDPGHIVARHSLANVLFQCARFEEAEAEYRQLLAMDAFREGALLGLGRSLYGQERWKESIEILSSVETLPQDAHFELARAHVKVGELSQADVLLSQWLDHYGPDALVLFNLGCTKGKLGFFDEAVACFEQCERHGLSKAGSERDFYLCKGLSLLSLRRVAEARHSLRQAAEASPGDPEVLYAQGVAAAHADAWDDAELAFRASIAAGSDQARAHFGLGLALEHAGDFAQGGRSYTNALAADPGFTEASKRLGVAQAKGGEWNAARATLGSVESSGFADQEIDLYLGLARAHLGDWEEAIRTWERLRHSPYDDAQLALNRAIVCYRLGEASFTDGDYASAVHWWGRSFEDSPETPEISRALAEACLRRAVNLLMNAHLDAEIEKLLHRVLNLLPNDSRASCYLGLYLLAMGRAGEAVFHLSSVIQRHPEDASVRFLLAQALLLAGDAPEAHSHILALDGEVNEAKVRVHLLRADAEAAAQRWHEALDAQLAALRHLSDDSREPLVAETGAS